MHDNRLVAQRLRLQELSHVRTEVTLLSVCACVLCLLYPCNSESVNHTGRGRGPARGSLFSASGSLDVAELLTRLCCDTVLAAPKEVSDHAVTHLGLLRVGQRRWDPPHKGTAGCFLLQSQSRSHTGNRPSLCAKHNCSALPCCLCETGDY